MASPAQAPASVGGPTSRTPFPVPTAEQQSALNVLRTTFPDEQIQHLPKILCGACSSSRTKVCENPKHQKTKCRDCGNYITTAHVDLDYVGHAELTNRLLDADPLWSWEPVAFGPDGLPTFDRNGGLWIRLTVAGMTRLGYGDAGGKTGPNAVKEAIGDALRNAAMRFGAALDLWAKSDLTAARSEHPTSEADDAARQSPARQAAQTTTENAPPPYIADQTGNAAAGRPGTAEDIAAAVDALKVKISNGWDNELATMQNLIEAQNNGIDKEMTPSGPNGQMVTFEQLLKERVEALRARKNGQGTTDAGGRAA